MRLLTHNMLACNIKGVTKGFPLGIEHTRLETKESELNADFLRHIFPKLDWKAFHEAAQSVGVNNIPDQVEPVMLDDDEFLRKFHHALLEVHLEEGALICPETGRRFPVTKGVPNMLLNEDEV
ncbi:multifunctional methyltransferase subunit TRM112 homolog A [Physcomitrium patens]|uniref:Trm112p-like protein n=1 Tax=Physcomitrium patens TaxID=3218 RepID=A9S9D3_PHYPA|nr:multifunctional methyltransferase subunit TRM112 homolog A-like [Physcomitrium patens]PNR46478.1 hypothetical protein PHYPA_013597 [Physcomitrium patens]|eukprot:XP_024386428.1 multifunctional methyltransferase subunit TRM112 homolog A-like [Physcomitrella patens]